jgi:hypothetical protein
MVEVLTVDLSMLDRSLLFPLGRLDINPVTQCHKAYESHIIICTDPNAMM